MRERLEELLSEFYGHDFPAFVPRQLYYPVIPHKTTVIMGMRRTGKTWLCYQKMQELVDSGIAKNRLLYLNFEDDRLFDFTVGDFRTILDVYYARFPENKNCLCYFFFDEIQMVKDWERFIRRLIDTENVQIALTGSSSRLLSTEIASSMRGRTAQCEVFPYSFKEYLCASGLLPEIPKYPTSGDRAKIRKGMKDYFLRGGFPETIHYTERDRQDTLQSYIDAVLFRDVVERYRISNITLLRHLIYAVLGSPSQKFSVNRFYNTMQSKGIRGGKNDLYLYLDYLTDAYFFFPVSIHTESERVRQTNPNKIYTIDTGILRTCLFNRDKNNGAMLENLVFEHLRRNRIQTEYVDTSDGYEIDFLTMNREGRKTLIQVSYDVSDEQTINRECHALNSAGDSLQIENRIIVSWDDEKELDHNIKVVPVWKFLLDHDETNDLHRA